MTRLVRDALVQAPVVGGVRWATWELTSKSLVDEVLAIAGARVSKAIPEGANDRASAAARRAC